ncbi:hypothetical protein ACHQM5_001971 [Ranunculus cassubicifolius]
MVSLLNPTPSFKLSLPSTPINQKLHNPISSSFSLTPNSSFHFQTPKRLTLQHRKTTRRYAISAVTQIDQTQFSDTVLKSDVPVLVEFVADWCGPCRLMAPAIDWAEEEYKGKLKIVKLDHDANPKLIEEYKVYGLPALIVFNQGKVVKGSAREGAMAKPKLKEYLDGILESVAIA